MNFEFHMNSVAYLGALLLLFVVAAKYVFSSGTKTSHQPTDSSSIMPPPKNSEKRGSGVAVPATRDDYILNKGGLTAQLLHTDETLKANREIS